LLAGPRLAASALPKACRVVSKRFLPRRETLAKAFAALELDALKAAVAGVSFAA
jgi:hypothetical protein